MYRSARDHHHGITAQHSTMPTLAKYVGSFQDTVYQDPLALSNSAKKRLHFNLSILLHDVSCEQK